MVEWPSTIAFQAVGEIDGIAEGRLEGYHAAVSAALLAVLVSATNV
jgi:hypothetical protein